MATTCNTAIKAYNDCAAQCKKAAEMIEKEKVASSKIEQELKIIEEKSMQVLEVAAFHRKKEQDYMSRFETFKAELNNLNDALARNISVAEAVLRRPKTPITLSFEEIEAQLAKLKATLRASEDE